MRSVALDGNAAAAALADVFLPEMTMALTKCATCSAMTRVAELRAYLQAPGVILRCARCGAVQIRLVRAPHRAWLDLRGVQVLELEGMPSP